MAAYRCPGCGASVAALVTEEADRASGKKVGKAKAQRNAARSELVTVKAELAIAKTQAATLSAQAAQIKALQAEIAVLRTPAGAAKVATEESAITAKVGSKGRGPGRRVVQLTPTQARVMGISR